MMSTRDRSSSRRGFLRASAGAATILCLPVPAWAIRPSMADAMRSVLGDDPITPGRVSLAIPAVAENGHSVPLTVEVESEMSPRDHVTAIHVFSEKNPLPDVVRFFLGERSGRARVSTRIRLADSQTIVAVASMSDGSRWSGSAKTVVTLAACVDIS